LAEECLAEGGEKLSDDFIRSRLAELKKHLPPTAAVSSETLRELEAICRIRELEKALEPSARSNRWLPVTAFFCTLVIISFIFLAHVRSTTIDLDGDVSEFSFYTTALHELSLPVLLREITVAGAGEIDFENDSEGYQNCIGIKQGFQTIRVSVIGTPSATNDISVGGFIVPPESLIRYVHSGESYRHQITIIPPRSAPAIEMKILAVGAAQIDLPGGCRRRTQATVPSVIAVRFSPESPVDINVEPFAHTAPNGIDLPVKKISLSRIEESSKVRAPQPLSNVLYGTLYFDALAGKARPLRQGERLEFSESNGTLHILDVDKDHLKLRFTGTVANIQSGEHEGHGTLMPTWFEWLKANESLLSAWGALIYFFGICVALIRWWRPSR
jgi:hypothetical protein